jgi:uncharacterized OB-fold protein
MATRLAPTVSPDSEFFWNGVRDNKLLIQRCKGCQSLRQPARPMCPVCNSLGWDTVESSGRGMVYSYVMPQHPPMPLMEYPYIVALVELEEGVRLVSNLCEIAPEDVETGMPVEVFDQTFDTLDGKDLVLHQFRPAR